MTPSRPRKPTHRLTGAPELRPAWELLLDKGVVVAAVSGGADSVALLRLLHEHAANGAAGLKVHVAHLNHALRGADADADEAFVRDLAAGLGLPFHARRVNVRALAEQRHLGIEAAARAARYEFFAAVAGKVRARAVALAHHADDNAETFIYRLRRGAHLRGLAGIPPARPLPGAPGVMIVRPLLDCRRDALRRWLEGRGHLWREDLSNRSPAFARNRVRHELLPALERAAPGATARILETIAALRALRQTLDEAARQAIAGRVSRRSHTAELPLDLPAAIFETALWLALEDLGAPLGGLNRGHFAELRALPDGGAVNLPGAWRAERRQRQLAILPQSTYDFPLSAAATAVATPGETALPWLGAVMSAETTPGGAGDLPGLLAGKSRWEEWADDAKCARPLEARPWRPGDRMKPLGAPGRRKVQDILTDAKTPRAERARATLVTAAGRPVWLVGHCIDDSVRVDAKTATLLHLALTKRDVPERT